VRPDTFFVHDPRFEQLRHPGLSRRFHSFTYWHLKHLKPDFGFGNYDLADNPQSRYARRLRRLRADHAVIGSDGLAKAESKGPGSWLAAHGLPARDRDRILVARAHAARELSRTPLETLLARDAELAPFLAIRDSA